MAGKRYKPEQLFQMLREAEIKLAGGRSAGEVCRALGISEQSYDRWRKECGGMQYRRRRSSRTWSARTPG